MVKSIDKVDIPDGQYDSIWSAYTVDIFAPGFILSSYSCKVNKGIKGSKETTVDVISGYLYIDLSIEDKRNLKIIEVIK
jgi:hypothetical protein